MFEIKPVRRALTDNNSIGLTDFVNMSDNFFIDNNSKICPEPQNASFGLTGLDHLFRTLPYVGCICWILDVSWYQKYVERIKHEPVKRLVAWTD